MQPKKYAIYTAMVGGYDEIMQPVVVDDRFDYILFSNDIKEDRVGIWQVRPIEYTNPDNTRVCRYIKTHPEELLLGYVASVWVDSSICIETNFIYRRTVELEVANIQIATIVHPDWICTYEELLGIMILQWESEEITIKWGQYLRKEKFPKEIGTWETGVLYRLHSSKQIKNFDNLWWWCIENFSRRDQYSFQYVLWKIGITCVGFLPNNYSVHNSEHFSIKTHLKSKNKYVEHNSRILNYYSKHADSQHEIERVYYWIYNRKNPFFWIKFIGILYRIKHMIISRLGKKPNYNVHLKSLKK